MKFKHDNLLSNFAFEFHLRHYTPAECCQYQRHIRDVTYIACDHTREVVTSRKLLKLADNCREVTTADNVFDANQRYKIKTGGTNRGKLINNAGEGVYAGVLNSYNDMPVDMQTGKMCVFLQATKPAPKVGIHLAGIRARGHKESPFMNCYSKKGAASYSYVDVNYAKGDDLMNIPLTYDYFDYTGDNYVKVGRWRLNPI